MFRSPLISLVLSLLAGCGAGSVSNDYARDPAAPLPGDSDSAGDVDAAGDFDAAGDVDDQGDAAGPADTQAPTVALSAPAPIELLSTGTTIAATASDDVGVESVVMQIDGQPFGVLPNAPPFELSADTTGLSTGRHMLIAVATDAAGNEATSAAVEIFVDNTPNGTPFACPTSAPVVLDAGNYLLDVDCQLPAGNLVMTDATLTVSQARLTVAGNISLSGSSVLRVLNGTLRVANTREFEFSVTAADDAVIYFRDAEVETNADPTTLALSLTSGYAGAGRSLIRFDNTNLTTSRSWLLASTFDDAAIQVDDYHQLPTESYPGGQSSVTIARGDEIARVWLNVHEGEALTLESLPAHDVRFDLSIGRNTPDIAALPYQVDVVDAKASIGVESHPGSDIRLADNQQPMTVAYNVANTTQPVSIQNLPMGSDRVTALFTDQGRRLELDNVLLDIIPWQLYVENETPGMQSVTISDSLVNELGLRRNATAELSDSTLQWALAVAFGQSSLRIADSTINSQIISAAGGSQIVVEDSSFWGTRLEASSGSTILSLNSVFNDNVCHADCSPMISYYCDAGRFLDPSSVCNPFAFSTPFTQVTGGVMSLDDYLDARFSASGGSGQESHIIIVGIDAQPAPLSAAQTSVPIAGDVVVRSDVITAADYELMYQDLAGGPATIVASGQAPIFHDALGVLPVGSMAPGDYALTLRVTLSSGQELLVGRPITVVP